jgi:hypothetical protein
MNIPRRKNGGEKREGAEKRCSLRTQVNLRNYSYYFKNEERITFTSGGRC